MWVGAPCTSEPMIIVATAVNNEVDDRDEATEAKEPTEAATRTPSGADADTEGDPSVQVDPVAEAEERISALKDQLLRTAADFDNFRKRARREAEDSLAQGRDAMLRELLPVFDNLDRATEHADKATDLGSLASGIAMVRRQFQDTLKRLGIERVPGLGTPFDPAVHEAIQQLETDQYPPGTVAGEVQGGYRLGERLIRPAMVVVAKAPAAATQDGDSSSSDE